MSASKAALQKLLGRSRFVRSYGLKLVSITDADCTIAMPFRHALERPGGTVNGPAFMAAADYAMWLAIKRHIGIEHDAVTSELNTAFLNAARRETVYCTARILKLGKRTIYGTAECHDLRGRIFTHHTVTYVRI
ncbi:MAG: PaaI family thioesterase [Betaproteobacteria bacterium]|nr:PaaI family thioesterase [Betaproteobacteria bacterium]